TSDFGFRISDLKSCTCTAASGLPSGSVTWPNTLPGGDSERSSLRCSVGPTGGKVATAIAVLSDAVIRTGPLVGGNRRRNSPVALAAPRCTSSSSEKTTTSAPAAGLPLAPVILQIGRAHV